MGRIIDGSVLRESALVDRILERGDEKAQKARQERPECRVVPMRPKSIDVTGMSSGLKRVILERLMEGPE